MTLIVSWTNIDLSWKLTLYYVDRWRRLWPLSKFHRILFTEFEYRKEVHTLSRLMPNISLPFNLWHDFEMETFRHVAKLPRRNVFFDVWKLKDWRWVWNLEAEISMQSFVFQCVFLCFSYTDTACNLSEIVQRQWMRTMSLSLSSLKNH